MLKKVENSKQLTVQEIVVRELFSPLAN